MQVLFQTTALKINEHISHKNTLFSVFCRSFSDSLKKFRLEDIEESRPSLVFRRLGECYYQLSQKYLKIPFFQQTKVNNRQ